MQPLILFVGAAAAVFVPTGSLVWLITSRLAENGEWHQSGNEKMRRWIKHARQWQYRQMTPQETADRDDRMVW